MAKRTVPKKSKSMPAGKNRLRITLNGRETYPIDIDDADRTKIEDIILANATDEDPLQEIIVGGVTMSKSLSDLVKAGFLTEEKARKLRLEAMFRPKETGAAEVKRIALYDEEGNNAKVDLQDGKGAQRFVKSPEKVQQLVGGKAWKEVKALLLAPRNADKRAAYEAWCKAHNKESGL